MTIFLGADHAGYELKNVLREHLTHRGYETTDVGAKTEDPDDDYPKYAYALASKILGAEDADLGILLCGSGQGMTMAANRVNGIRAALAWNVESAVASREDDNSNVLVLPARFIARELAVQMVDAWLDSKFKRDPKYSRRLDELEQLYG